MGTYVISDIHGCYREFLMMLEEIKFSDADCLFLAGDYIDLMFQIDKIATICRPFYKNDCAILSLPHRTRGKNDV